VPTRIGKIGFFLRLLLNFVWEMYVASKKSINSIALALELVVAGHSTRQLFLFTFFYINSWKKAKKI
jgi:hypothetical protein